MRKINVVHFNVTKWTYVEYDDAGENNVDVVSFTVCCFKDDINLQVKYKERSIIMFIFKSSALAQLNSEGYRLMPVTSHIPMLFPDLRKGLSWLTRTSYLMFRRNVPFRTNMTMSISIL